VNEVEQLEKKVKDLSPRELAEFRAWFIEFDARVGNEQIEADLEAGKLDGLIAEALAEHKAGRAHG